MSRLAIKVGDLILPLNDYKQYFRLFLPSARD